MIRSVKTVIVLYALAVAMAFGQEKDSGDTKMNKKNMTEEQVYVCVQGGTERPFTGKYWDHKGQGVYTCSVCGSELFKSDAKYTSGSGWPSFYRALDPDKIKKHIDRSHGMTRTEILCAKCGSHLGHLFNDGPKPTGQRYCVNSVSLDFRPSDTKKEKPVK